MAESPRVVIVGGGVAGLLASYFLAVRGARVTVLESHRMGHAASSSNAGWVCPGQAGPLPAPRLVGYGLRSLVTPDAPLYFAPSYLPHMVSWLARFAMRCNSRDHRRGTAALAQLGRRTFELVELLVADGVEAVVHRRGLLVAGRDRGGVERFLDGLQPLRAAGFRIPSGVLGGGELREMEPALTGDVGAGLLVEDHWHVDAPSFMGALATRLARMDVALEEGAEAVEFIGAAGRVREVVGTAGSHPADAVVLAAGAWSRPLARRLGFDLPIRPGKGYSVELRIDAPPQHALLLLDPHVGCSPLDGRVRIAGTMEFSGINARRDDRRIAAIVRGASSMLGGLESRELEDVRTGMRPIAPDGLPIVDRAPRHENVYLATGYSMLGMTLAAPAGEALAELILTGRRPPEIDPFRATRFAWRRRRNAAAGRWD